MLEIDFAKAGGIVPAVIQDSSTGEVLMLGYMNEIALQKTIDTGKVWFFSRSKNRLWMKGETSGHLQLVKGIFVDCDQDAILVKVDQQGGAACHTGRRSCFYRMHQKDGWHSISEPVFDPETVYGKQDQ